jgi:hypothetical protein
MNHSEGIQQPGAVHGAPGHADHGHAGPATSPFSEAEIQEFQRSDRGAAAVIILLMTGIFGVGVCLYATIAIVTY